MAGTGIVAPVMAKDLNLSNRPLFSGGNVKPNIMVALDNSGSMDFETLFPTDSGLLYWNDSTRSAWQSGTYVQSSPVGYAYLFPNGYNGCNADGSGCSARDRRIYSNYSAVPPIPSLGFARSPEFNVAYFNPAVSYDPWVGYADANATSAYYDPKVRSATLNLTVARQSTADGELFDFRSGMVIPAGVSYYQTITTGSQTTMSNVCVRSASDFYSAGLFEALFGYCSRSGYTFYRSATVNGGNTTATGFYPSTTDKTTGNESIPVSYYPATFYLLRSTTLPSNFGWSNSAARILGKGSNGEDLYGYEIKPENFSSTAAYNAAMQNFANWFSYYRKRHLAVRGGITGAFSEINGARVGSCTINNPATLTMRDLDSTTDRQAFYDQIFSTDFAAARGTPNRKALKFLGEQLENNANIITSSCQQNFALLFTDGYNTDSVNGVGNADQSSNARKTFGAPFGDNYSNTIADVAMKYYENLGSVPNERQRGIERHRVPTPLGCDDNPPDPWLDCEDDLHMVTFGVTLGQRGLIFGNTAQYPSQNADPYRNPPDWSKLNLNDNSYGLSEIDDLWHATINSRGTLLNANTPAEIASSFATALEEIINAAGSEAAVSSNTRSLSTNSVIYQSSFTGGAWEGDLKAYALNGASIGDTPIWSAANRLVDTSKTNATIANNRRIVISLAQGTAANPNYRGYAFRPTALQTVLGGLTSLLGDPLTANQINYLRGDRSLEQSRSPIGSFRNRGTTVLGDIVHSAPVYVGAPDRLRYPINWQDLRLGANAPVSPEAAAGPYSAAGNSRAFAQANASRKPMVYVGANDGMLHGFAASDGSEQFAFIPGGVTANLSQLTRTDYQHQYYVDGTPATGDVAYNGAWHTVLVGGLGNGGRTLYALDITNPSAFSSVESNPSSLFMWEFSHPRLGKTFGQPSIVRLHSGQWAAMAGNGYNSNGESASLFLIDIQSGNLITNGPIETGATPPNGGSSNGLSEPFPVDVDGDFIVDYAYAGDLYGNVWRFDLTAKTPANWRATKLFTARDRNGNPQPITTQPQVGLHSFGNNYGVMVYVGTGKYIENSDATLNTGLRNSVYGVWDVGTFNFAPGDGWVPTRTANLSRSDLVVQDVLAQTVDSNGETYRVVTDNPVVYQQSNASNDPGKRGWVLDLPAGTGELIVSNPALEGQTVSFSTTIPDVQACTTEGSGYFMKVKARTGGRTDFASFDLNGDRQYTTPTDTVTVNGQKVVVSGVAIKGGAPGAALHLNDTSQIGDRVVVGASDASRRVINIFSGAQADGRRSWREIRR
ncbi:PilC/PilY family type IV pilus protein [Salinisphaera sp. T31B1]|uniref:pilus assembly protein n=1 Tax=Salinisphaera sp. T31B1 TaxID=727963 RepID=UPI00333EEE1F